MPQAICVVCDDSCEMFGSTSRREFELSGELMVYFFTESHASGTPIRRLFHHDDVVR